VGRMPDVLDQIHRAHRIGDLWSHPETGNAITDSRDRRVAVWAWEPRCNRCPRAIRISSRPPRG
jgi:hypothetical protein